VFLGSDLLVGASILRFADRLRASSGEPLRRTPTALGNDKGVCLDTCAMHKAQKLYIRQQIIVGLLYIIDMNHYKYDPTARAFVRLPRKWQKQLLSIQKQIH